MLSTQYEQISTKPFPDADRDAETNASNRKSRVDSTPAATNGSRRSCNAIRSKEASRETLASPHAEPGGRRNYSFFWQWLKRPGQTGSAIPSGHQLTRLMTAKISISSGRILELGPGTEAFTDAMIKFGVPQHNLKIV